ncbi:MAG: hypothetical protein R3C11_29245 [Planctomycetaceae bacterium]
MNQPTQPLRNDLDSDRWSRWTRVFGVDKFGVIDLSADRMVIWVKSDGTGRQLQDQEFDQNTPLQIYMEGDIIIRQGSNTSLLLMPSTM